MKFNDIIYKDEIDFSTERVSHFMKRKNKNEARKAIRKLDKELYDYKSSNVKFAEAISGAVFLGCGVIPAIFAEFNNSLSLTALFFGSFYVMIGVAFLPIAYALKKNKSLDKKSKDLKQEYSEVFGEQYSEEVTL